MLSLPKHLARATNQTQCNETSEMLRQAQHDVLEYSFANSFTASMLKILFALLLPSALLYIACQRVASSAQRTASNTILVQGKMHYGTDTTAFKGFEAVFMRDLRAPATEHIVAEGMTETGRYKVRLLAGQLYYIKLSLKAQNYLVETQEFFASTTSRNTVLTKDFYMSYPDSTEYGGCLAGWHPPR